MPDKHRKPNHHAMKVKEEYHKLKREHPTMDHKKLFGMASKRAAGKTGKGLHIHPYGSGLHIVPRC